MSCTQTTQNNAMIFSPLSLKVLVITFVIAALGGGAAAMTRSKSIDSAVLGSEWQCHKTVFVITTCALRAQPQEDANAVRAIAVRNPLDRAVTRATTGVFSPTL